MKLKLVLLPCCKFLNYMNTVRRSYATQDARRKQAASATVLTSASASASEVQVEVGSSASQAASRRASTRVAQQRKYLILSTTRTSINKCECRGKDQNKQAQAIIYIYRNKFERGTMVDVDVEHVIIEVKRRPVLWDPNHPDFNQRHSKLAAWEEVSANIYVDWCDLSNYDKFGRARDMQNKWKNIRDCYIRELKYERKVEKGLAFPKKNKYKYSHLLGFLNSGEKRSLKEATTSEEELSAQPPASKDTVNLVVVLPNGDRKQLSIPKKDSNCTLNNFIHGINGSRDKDKRTVSGQEALQNLDSNEVQWSGNDNSRSDISSTTAEGSPEIKEEANKPKTNIKERKREIQSSEAHRNGPVKANGSKRAKRFKSNSDSSMNLNLQSDSSTMDSDCNNQTADGNGRERKQSNIPLEATPQLNHPIEVDRSTNHPASQSLQNYYTNELNKGSAEYLTPSVETRLRFLTPPQEEDGDKMFLLSLLPYFKKLNEERNLQARIEISTLLQKMIYHKC